MAKPQPQKPLRGRRDDEPQQHTTGTNEADERPADPGAAQATEDHQTVSAGPEDDTQGSKHGQVKASTMLTETTVPGVTDYASLPGAPRDSLVLGPDESLRVDGEPTADGTGIRLNRDVVRAFMPLGSKRWGFVLEYPKGHIIPQSAVVKLSNGDDK